MRVLILFLIILPGCGTYVGSEGLVYNSNEFLDFQTPETKKQYEKQIEEAYEAGKKDAPKPEMKPVDSGKVEIISKEKVADLGGGLVDILVPFSGPIGFLIMIGIGLFKRRKEDE